MQMGMGVGIRDSYRNGCGLRIGLGIRLGLGH